MAVARIISSVRFTFKSLGIALPSPNSENFARHARNTLKKEHSDNPRKVRAIYQNDRKSDRKDAEMLARIARSDESLLHPVKHVGEEMQRDLLQIKLRDNLVRQRVDIISSVRFTFKSLGIALPSPNSETFPSRVGFRWWFLHFHVLVFPQGT